MGVGLVRSLQPPDILWIHWRVYNFIANTSKGVLFLPSSDVYVRSFLCPFYTLIKLYCTKALSEQALALAPDWILLLRGPRIPVSSRDSTTTFRQESHMRGLLPNKWWLLTASPVALCRLTLGMFCKWGQWLIVYVHSQGWHDGTESDFLPKTLQKYSIKRENIKVVIPANTFFEGKKNMQKSFFHEKLAYILFL